MAAIFPRNLSQNLPRKFLGAKLEVTFPYSCGGRVAAEFDARVAVGLEDGVLIAGEVELYGYDDDHEGAYEICHDKELAESVRGFILGNSKETARAYEILANSGGYSGNSSGSVSGSITGSFSGSFSGQKASNFIASHNSTQPRSGFEDFVQYYGQCHSLLAPHKS